MGVLSRISHEKRIILRLIVLVLKAPHSTRFEQHYLIRFARRYAQRVYFSLLIPPLDGSMFSTVHRILNGGDFPLHSETEKISGNAVKHRDGQLRPWKAGEISVEKKEIGKRILIH